MSPSLLSSVYLSLACQEKSKAQVSLELVTSLKIMFEFVEKPKSVSLAWLGLA